MLSLFMGGMALGAAVVSRYGTQWRNLIKAFDIVYIPDNHASTA